MISVHASWDGELIYLKEVCENKCIVEWFPSWLMPRHHRRDFLIAQPSHHKQIRTIFWRGSATRQHRRATGLARDVLNSWERKMSVRAVAFCLALFIGWTGVLADTIADCSQGIDNELRIEACTEVIERLDKPPDELARAYRNRGSAYSVIGSQEKAIADFTEAIRLKGDYAIAFGDRGQAKLAKGEFHGAIADYSDAIRFKANYPNAYVSRGYAYLVEGDMDRAIADFSKTLQLDPGNVIALNNRGLAHRQKGELDLAIEDYTPAVRFNPIYALAYNNRGYVYEAKGQKPEARNHCAAREKPAIPPG